MTETPETRPRDKTEKIVVVALALVVAVGALLALTFAAVSHDNAHGTGYSAACRSAVASQDAWVRRELRAQAGGTALGMPALNTQASHLKAMQGICPRNVRVEFLKLT